MATQPLNPTWNYRCKLCGATPEDGAEFYRGVTSRCKPCHRDAVRANRAAKVDYYRAYDAQRFQEDPKVRARHKRYQATEAGKEAVQRAHAKYKANNPEKTAARYTLNNAVRDGKIMKPDACSSCNATGVRIEGHHHDYSKPLDVEWLCNACHRAQHKDAA